MRKGKPQEQNLWRTGFDQSNESVFFLDAKKSRIISKGVNVLWKFSGWSVYLVVLGAAYLKRRRDIGECCGSLVTPGGDSGGRPHLKHTKTHGTYQWCSMGGGGWHAKHHNTLEEPGFKLQKHGWNKKYILYIEKNDFALTHNKHIFH